MGSVRSERLGIKVANWVTQKLEERGHTVSLLDPLTLQLPLLDKMYKEMNTTPENLKRLYTVIKEADGYIPITPEYNHSVSSAMKNTLDYFLEEYFFKPSAIFHIPLDLLEEYLLVIILDKSSQRWVRLLSLLNYQYLKFRICLEKTGIYSIKTMTEESLNSLMNLNYISLVFQNKERKELLTKFFHQCLVLL